MKKLPECRSCSSKDLEQVLSLGKMPLANAYLSPDDLKKPEPLYQLDLAFCPHCFLVQIVETVPPEELFREYLYFSSFSTTMLERAKKTALELVRERKLNSRSLVVEIASNDGYLLQYFKKAGIPVLGIEPALNVAEVAEEKGIPTMTEFFSQELAQKLQHLGRQADLILANNVLAHVADINDFVKGIGTLLKENGVAVFEFPYVKEMIERCEFDTIYHEHVFYFSASSLYRLFKKNNLLIFHIERIPIHGGSLRIHVAHENKISGRGSIKDFLDKEKALGMTGINYYADFSTRVEKLKKQLQSLLQDLKKSGKKLAAYGAAAKGTVLLNYCNLGKSLLDFVVDRSTYKQGKYMPGVQLPIYPTEKLLEEKPDYVLLLTWNFADEILSQQSRYRENGGKFILPVPEPAIV